MTISRIARYIFHLQGSLSADGGGPPHVDTGAGQVSIITRQNLLSDALEMNARLAIENRGIIQTISTCRPAIRRRPRQWAPIGRKKSLASGGLDAHWRRLARAAAIRRLQRTEDR